MTDEFFPPHKTVKETIEALQRLVDTHGDMPVALLYEDRNGLNFDFDHMFEMLEVSDDPAALEKDSGVEMKKMCVFALPMEEAPFRPNLKVVRDEH